VAEAIDWVGALHALGVSELDRSTAHLTIGSVVKTPDDLELVGAAIDRGDLPIGS